MSKDTPRYAEGSPIFENSVYLSRIRRADERTRTADLLIASEPLGRRKRRASLRALASSNSPEPHPGAGLAAGYAVGASTSVPPAGRSTARKATPAIVPTCVRPRARELEQRPPPKGTSSIPPLCPTTESPGASWSLRNLSLHSARRAAGTAPGDRVPSRRCAGVAGERAGYTDETNHRKEYPPWDHSPQLWH